jgi:H+/Cl- antiporter ClcA
MIIFICCFLWAGIGVGYILYEWTERWDVSLEDFITILFCGILGGLLAAFTAWLISHSEKRPKIERRPIFRKRTK